MGSSLTVSVSVESWGFRPTLVQSSAQGGVLRALYFWGLLLLLLLFGSLVSGLVVLFFIHFSWKKAREEKLLVTSPSFSVISSTRSDAILCQSSPRSKVCVFSVE